MFQKLLEKLAIELKKKRIDYIVIGGQALLIYGEPRLTKDIDITLGIGPDRLSEIDGIVKDEGWKILIESPQDFVIHKVIAGRPRDLEDIRVVLLKNPRPDIVYIKKWLKEFEGALSQPFLARFNAIPKKT